MPLKQNGRNKIADNRSKSSTRRNLSERSGKSEITTASTAKRILDTAILLENSKKKKEVRTGNQ